MNNLDPNQLPSVESEHGKEDFVKFVIIIPKDKLSDFVNGLPKIAGPHVIGSLIQSIEDVKDIPVFKSESQNLPLRLEDFGIKYGIGEEGVKKLSAQHSRSKAQDPIKRFIDKRREL